MFDAHLRPVIDPVLNRIGRTLARRGATADGITIAGFAIGAVGGLALAAGLYWTALAFILLNRAMDGLDGAVARVSGPTDFGGYLDIVLDFLFYSGIVFGFAIGRPEDALAAAFLIFSFVGTGSSFLAYAVIAAKRGVTTEVRGRKSLYYVGGLTEGTETIAVFVLICLFPDLFSWFAYVFGALCWLTTGARITAAANAFRS